MNTTSQQQPAHENFDTWGVLELMGRQRLAGRITEQTIGGVAFVRIDVPQVGSTPAYSRLFTGQAIYGIAPMTEQLALRVAQTLRAAPISHYDIREAPPVAGLVGGSTPTPTPTLWSENADEDEDQDDDPEAA